MAAGAVQIDLHSRPAGAWPVEPDREAERPQFVLGTGPRLAPEVRREALLGHFGAAAYSTGLDRPQGVPSTPVPGRR